MMNYYHSVVLSTNYIAYCIMHRIHKKRKIGIIHSVIKTDIMCLKIGQIIFPSV